MLGRFLYLQDDLPVAHLSPVQDQMEEFFPLKRLQVVVESVEAGKAGSNCLRTNLLAS